MSKVLIGELKALDYRGSLGDIARSIPTDTLKRLSDEIHARYPKPSDSLTYFCLRVRSALEGAPHEERPLASANDAHEFAKVVLPNAMVFVTMETMHREGEIRILKYPANFTSKTDTFDVIGTAKGRKHLKALDAQQANESAQRIPDAEEIDERRQRGRPRRASTTENPAQ